MKMFRTASAALITTLLAGAAPAEDLALVLSNSDYASLPRIYSERAMDDTERRLANAGFRVFGGSDLDARAMVAEAEAFGRAMGQGGTDRVVVVLSGHFASEPGRVWLLGVGARNPSGLNVGQQAISLDALADLIRPAAGRAVMMIADNNQSYNAGGWLRTTAALPDSPQGVTIVKGAPRAMADVLDRGFLTSGKKLSQIARDLPSGAIIAGFVSPHVAFTPRQAQQMPDLDALNERAYWDAVRDIATLEAVQTYLKRYPRGRFANEANQMIRALREAERRRAQQVELALNLSSEDRREIQRALSLIGFDPRGIDGVFGPASRAAITGWQRSRGFDDTGYLTRQQINALRRAAEIRAAELEEEARQRREELERQDRAYWGQTGGGQSEQGLRAYLQRYPDGLFAEEARARLQEIVEQRRQDARREERNAWDRAVNADTIPAYREFMKLYPRSAFSEAAKSRIEELKRERQDQAQIKAAKQEEARVAGNKVARVLVERQLERLGLKPGVVDGDFDARTRRAIRRFQRDRDLPVTGYVTQITMVQLLASF